MPFTRILKELTEKSGAKGAIMLDYDGEVVASYSEAETLEIDLIGAHHGIILNIIKDAAARSSGGMVSSVSISTDILRIAISSIKDDYYLVMAMDRRSPVGKAAFESRRAVKELEKEMG